MFFRFGIPMFLTLIFGLPLVYGGFIDPRYPDYIVDPLVPCEEDGFFVHPRNCSWFYRCHSNENITGFYPRRDYFECAPGTVFSRRSSVCDVGNSEKCDEVITPLPPTTLSPTTLSPTTLLPTLPPPPPNCDDCVFANVNVEDGLCNHFEVCPDLNNKSLKVGVMLCPNPKYACDRCTHLNACNEGEWLLIGSDPSPPSRLRYSFPIQCYYSPYSPEMQCSVTLPSPNPCGKCTNSVSDCQVYEVCPDGVSSITLTMCAIAEKVCETCPAQKLCSVGEYFENVEQICYPSPDSPPMQCPTTPAATCSNCSVQTSFCNEIEICTNGINPVSKKFCALAVKECTTCDLKEVMCPEVGFFFSEDDQKCYSWPISSEWQCPTTGSPTESGPGQELTTTLPTDICAIITSGCSEVPNVCPDGAKAVTLTLCTSATRKCDAFPGQNVCAVGEYYSKTEEKCYSEANLSCSLKPISTSTVLPTETPCTDCYIDTVRCEAHTVCPHGEPATTMRFCRKATNVCLPCGSTEEICHNGQFYAMERKSCFPNPNSREMQCREPHTVRDAAVNKQALAPKKTPVVQCTGKNLLPQDQWIKEKFCKNYQSCFRGIGKPTGIIELCTNYFECIYDVIDQDWNLVRSSCPERKLFSYEAQSCVSEPVDICRVF